MKLSLSKLICLLAFVGQFAFAGVAVPVPYRVKLTCQDWLGTRLTFGQYNNSDTVTLQYANGTYRSGKGYINDQGQGNVYVQETAKQYSFYWANGQLNMQISRLGENPGYGVCVLN